MDVAREFRESGRRQAAIRERKFLEAEARLLGVSVESIVAARFAAEPTPMEELGRAWRRANDAFVKMIEDFARGWNNP